MISKLENCYLNNDKTFIKDYFYIYICKSHVRFSYLKVCRFLWSSLRKISETSARIACRELPTLEEQLILSSAEIIPGNVILQIHPRIDPRVPLRDFTKLGRLRVVSIKKKKKK